MSLVCWSGGADSTLVLYDLLRAYKEMEKPSVMDEVRTVSVRHLQLGANREQFEARKRIREILRKRGLRFKCGEVGFRYKGGFHVKQEGLTQAMFWMGIALPYLRSGEKLYIGYVKGDSIWSYWAHLRQVFDSGASVLGLSDVDLETPLYNVRKAEVLSRLRRARLIRATWTCEDPKKGRPCGRCRPCKGRVLARYELRRWPVKEG